MSGVPLPGMGEHVGRQSCPGITDFLL
jgi:hypothetical protein